MKISIGVFFGGKTVEHEISVISALQAIENMDKDRYDIVPVYITKKNEFYAGDGVGSIDEYKNIPALLKKAQRVVPVCEGKRVALLKYPARNKKPVQAYIDIAFPIVHGNNVEDGTLQGYLKMLNLPFVGPDVDGSAVGMDKCVMKSVLKDAGIPVLDGCRYHVQAFKDSEDAVVEDVEKRIGYPVIIKPVNLGSSIGISVARDREALYESLTDAFAYSDAVLAEHAIQNLQEINCSVLGDAGYAEASECEEPLNGGEILSYENKYIGGNGSKDGAKGGSKGASGANGGSKGMATLSRRIPAAISDEERSRIRAIAVEAFKALNLNGVCRIDFMIDRDTDVIYLNEVNTIPGSLSFYLWDAIGVPYRELLNRMIELALKRKRLEDETTYSFDTNVLANVSIGGSKGSKNGKGSGEAGQISGLTGSKYAIVDGRRIEKEQ